MNTLYYRLCTLYTVYFTLYTSQCSDETVWKSKNLRNMKEKGIKKGRPWPGTREVLYVHKVWSMMHEILAHTTTDRTLQRLQSIEKAQHEFNWCMTEQEMTEQAVMYNAYKYKFHNA